VIEYSLKYSVTIRFDDLDSMSDDLEQSFDDLDFTSIYFDNLDLTLNDLELSIIEYQDSNREDFVLQRPSQFATVLLTIRLASLYRRKIGSGGRS